MQCFDSSRAPGAATQSCRAGIVLLAGWLGLLAACGGGGGAGGGVPGAGNPPPPPIPQPVTQTIGVAGGTIVGPNNVTLLIPPDALQTDTQLTIAVDSTGVPAQPLPAEANTVGAVYSLTPHGTTFGVPVTLSIPFDPSAFPAGVTPAVFKTNERGDAWQQLVAEVNGNTLTVAATSFSQVRTIIAVDAGSHAPVVIIDEPDDQTGFEGGFAFFRVATALAIGPQSFQWFRNGVRMPGETNPEILLPHLRIADDNSLYMVRVSVGTSGTLFRDSRAARLLITPRAPVIVNQPTDEQVIAGQSASFTAASRRQSRRRCSGRAARPAAPTSPVKPPPRSASWHRTATMAPAFDSAPPTAGARPAAAKRDCRSFRSRCSRPSRSSHSR